MWCGSKNDSLQRQWNFSHNTSLSPCSFVPHPPTPTTQYTTTTTTDAFEDAGDTRNGVQTEEKVHVRVQQRSGRKCITTVAGLADDLDIKRICKAFKKNFSCNGAVQKDEDVGEVIQLSGDQRTNVKSFLVDQEICLADSIVLHGF
jgi:translation initiation factor 1